MDRFISSQRDLISFRLDTFSDAFCQGDFVDDLTSCDHLRKVPVYFEVPRIATQGCILITLPMEMFSRPEHEATNLAELSITADFL